MLCCHVMRSSTGTPTSSSLLIPPHLHRRCSCSRRRCCHRCCHLAAGHHFSSLKSKLNRGPRCACFSCHRGLAAHAPTLHLSSLVRNTMQESPPHHLRPHHRHFAPVWEYIATYAAWENGPKKEVVALAVRNMPVLKIYY